MPTLHVPPLPKYALVADKLMIPIMFVVRGFRTDSLQETHAWHPYPVDPDRVDLTLAVPSQGADNTIYSYRYSFLFHLPIFGGWKNYSVYEVDKKYVPFRIGWVMRQATTGKLIEAKLQRLPVDDNQIRTLDGPPSFKGYFFAVDSKGKQIPLKRVGRGRLGDGQFLSVRLF